MAKFAFVNLPFHAHINPTLPVVQELIARGDQVVYYLTEKYRGAIEATGATFYSYQSILEQPVGKVQEESNPLALPMLMVDECCSVMSQILESVHREAPDCLIYNPMSVSGRFIAQLLGIPAVISRAFFAPHEKNLRAYQFGKKDPAIEERLRTSMEQLCSRYPIEPFDVVSMFLHKEALNIVYVPRSFQPYGEAFGPEYVFVGPSIGLHCATADFPFEQLDTTQPLIYITLGTVANNNPEFFNMCFTAFAEHPWQVVITTGRPLEQLNLSTPPNNVLVRSYVPQFEILQQAALCIHHGGMATIMDCLFLGIPMIAIPQAANQQPNARRIAETGLGILLEKESVNAEILRETVAHILNDPTFQVRARQMQKNAHAAGGFQAAADALQHFAKRPLSPAREGVI
jgi:MGT family glycosyltransferase